MFKTISIDFTNCIHSQCGCNPLDFVRYDQQRKRYSEQDIITISACLAPIENDIEPFWDLAVRMVLESLIGYVLECCPRAEHNLNTVPYSLSGVSSPSTY